MSPAALTDQAVDTVRFALGERGALVTALLEERLAAERRARLWWRVAAWLLVTLALGTCAGAVLFQRAPQ